MSQEQDEDRVLTLSGMYEDYFLDYSSYVILERAVPSIVDGLKPVQRRILHAMKSTDDGRYHKVANIIGNTMQFHPHGDAAIGDALVNLGQKDLLIDCQGNWGDTRTGDGAAASRYIEARLSKFALEVSFNPQTTEWQDSYDGRKKEPIDLPMKFPLVLAMGVDGIAVGLSTKILPHNFNELIDASIKVLQDKDFILYPDFQNGGLVDVSDYNDGKRGGRVKVRAKIEIEDKKTLKITELPYGVTTLQLIDSIIKANDKGKIKIKRVIDNTAEHVEILVELNAGVSPELTLDALYAFTNCEVSISPNACVIVDDKPHFLTVKEILKINTFQTKELLKRELQIKEGELLEKWLFASLEKIFIENRVYREIEECETWEAVLETIELEMAKYVAEPNKHKGASDQRLLLTRTLSQDDYIRLTEIKIKRISKFNSFKADELITNLQTELKEVRENLENLTDFTIDYYTHLKNKYGKDRTRRTIITSFETIEATQVVANNTKLYANYDEGIIGMDLKKDVFVCDCSDIDEIIVFRKDGIFLVTKIANKTFVGKGIQHIAVWKRGDERTTYNLIYLDASNGRTMAKRFNVTAITRDKEYSLISDAKGSKMLYFSVQPNGEGELVTVQLTQGCSAKKKIFEYDLGELAIKGRGVKGNLVTKYPVRKITLKEVGRSTLGAIKIWMDEVSGRFNQEERGLYLGAYDTGDQILVVYKEGTYEIIDFDLTKRLDPQEVMLIEKFDNEKVIAAIYYDGTKQGSYIKRFQIETTTAEHRFNFVSEHRSTQINYITTEPHPKVTFTVRIKGKNYSSQLALDEFVDVKGWKALGNKLSDHKVVKVEVEEVKESDSE